MFVEAGEAWCLKRIVFYKEQTAQKNEKKANEYFQIIRYAVSGQAGGPDLFPMLEVFGKDKVIARITAFINA